jgi:hypothetical protein
MKNGETKLRAREPQLYYLKRRLNLNDKPSDPASEAQQVVMLRVEQVSSITESQVDD